tara:strand:- start:170 stop:1288 length:1119 start_codon:yes stop_codon:yes gene_type:complete
MAIRPIRELANDAFTELKQIQSGEKLLVKTGDPLIDDHIGGLLPGDAVIISGLSGHGKSEFLFRKREAILDVKINPKADNYVWLNYNLEVKVLNVVLRGLHRKLKKRKQDILFKEFTKEEKDLANEYFELLQDDRQFIEQDQTTSEDFYTKTREFLLKHTDKDAVLVSFDHVALNADKDTQKGIEELIRSANKLKLEFDNAYFFFVSQLNRAILSRVAEKNNNAAPNAGDIYLSSVMDFIASYNIIVFNANKVGIEQFMKVSPDRYSYLSDHFGDEDSKGRVSFNTVGKLFFKVIKTRESDVIWKDLYITDMDLSEEEVEKLKNVDKNTFVPSDKPIFSKPAAEIFDTPPTASLGEAFGPASEAENEDDMPF